MDQSNMVGHNLNFAPHSTWNQITNPEFHAYRFAFAPHQTNLHSASRSTWNQITNSQFLMHPSVFAPNPYSLYNPYGPTPIGTLSYCSATTYHFHNPHAIPSSHNASLGSHVRVHNQHRPIQEPVDDFMDQILMYLYSMVESLEREAENTFALLDSVIDWSTPRNSNLVPQEQYSSYISVPNSYLQHESQRPIFSPTMFLDEEDMTYERLLFLEEEMGHISTRLSAETISKHLKIGTRVSSANNEPPNGEEPEICVICQGEYATNEKIGILQCRHEYHEDCIKKWLLQKNVCPICKCTALTGEKKN